MNRRRKFGFKYLSSIIVFVESKYLGDPIFVVPEILQKHGVNAPREHIKQEVRNTIVMMDRLNYIKSLN